MPEPLDFSKIQPILENHGGQDGALIPILQEVQALYGYLPEEALKIVSNGLKIPLSRVYGIVTFYAQFYLNPRGRHTVRGCRGNACHVRGGKTVLNTVKEMLGVDDGETTQDFNFSLETVACLGTCFLAPVMMVDRSYYGKLIPQKIASIIKQHS